MRFFTIKIMLLGVSIVSFLSLSGMQRKDLLAGYVSEPVLRDWQDRKKSYFVVDSKKMFRKVVGENYTQSESFSCNPGLYHGLFSKAVVLAEGMCGGEDSSNSFILVAENRCGVKVETLHAILMGIKVYSDTKKRKFINLTGVIDAVRDIQEPDEQDEREKESEHDKDREVARLTEQIESLTKEFNNRKSPAITSQTIGIDKGYSIKALVGTGFGCFVGGIFLTKFLPTMISYLGIQIN